MEEKGGEHAVLCLNFMLCGKLRPEVVENPYKHTPAPNKK